MTTSCPKTTKEDVWHCCFGHLNLKSLQKLAKNNLVDDFDFTATHEIQFRESCLKRKQHKSSFPVKTETQAIELLELVHSNICDKINTKS